MPVNWVWVVTDDFGESWVTKDINGPRPTPSRLYPGGWTNDNGWRQSMKTRILEELFGFKLQPMSCVRLSVTFNGEMLADEVLPEPEQRQERVIIIEE